MVYDGLVYAVDVGYFFDSDADGVGDFKGLTRKVPYLDDLGVGAIWLLPFFPSSGDNGYAVDDHYQVSDDLGTLEDFVMFVEECDERGIDVILDFVINHTSNGHPWFMAARNDRDTRFDDYYLWADQKPERPLRGTMFPGEVENVWHFDERAGQFYYSRYYPFEPSLNAANAEVQAEIEAIMEYWLSFGVRGFRIDSANHLVERKGRDGPKAGMELFGELLAHARSVDPDATLLGETDVSAERYGDFYGDGKRLPLLMSFRFSRYAFLALAEQEAAPLVDALDELYEHVPPHAMVNFLRNLDELDLEKLSDDQLETVLDTFAPKPEARLYGRGTRRRLAPMLGDRRRVKMAFNLLFATPGVPMIAYGDEVGMGENLHLRGRASVRTPMPWSDEENAGFSTATELAREPVKSGEFSYENANVEAAREREDSILTECKALAQVRSEYDPLSFSNHTLAARGSVMVVTYRDGDRVLTALINLSDDGREIDGPDGSLAEIHSDGQYENRSRIDGYGYRWFTNA